MKKLLIAVVIVGAAAATFPLWASCDLRYDACSTLCSVQHFNSDVKRAACKTRCAGKKAGCLLEQ